MLEEGAWTEIRDSQAFTVFCAVLAAVAILLAGLGAWLWGEITSEYTPDGFFVDVVVLGTIFAIILWLAMVAVTYLLLSQVFGAEVAPDALFRVMAVAVAPWALAVLMFVPELNTFIGFAAIGLLIFFSTFGLQAAFGIRPFNALVSVMAGFAVFAIVLSLLITWDNSFFNGPFLFEGLEDSATKSFGGGSDIDFDFDFDTEDFFEPSE